MQIRVAQAGIGGVEEHFAGARFARTYIFDDKRLVGFVQNGGLHELSSDYAARCRQDGKAPPDALDRAGDASLYAFDDSKVTGHAAFKRRKRSFIFRRFMGCDGSFK